MGVVGLAALVANGGVAVMLYRFRTEDANMRSATRRCCSRPWEFSARGQAGRMWSWPRLWAGWGSGVAGRSSIKHVANCTRNAHLVPPWRPSRTMAAHDHHHDHHHGVGGHQHTPANFGKAFAIGIALNLAYVVGEVFTGSSRIRSPCSPMPATISATCWGLPARGSPRFSGGDGRANTRACRQFATRGAAGLIQASQSMNWRVSTGQDDWAR